VKSSTKWLVLILVLVLAYLGWKYLWPRGDGQKLQARAEDPALLLDRVWIDSKPEKYTDYVHAALFLDYAPMGIFQKASAYHAIVEIFEFERSGNKVKMRFPQRDKRKRFSFKITACDDLPPFDLCLSLSKNPWGGPKQYYGLRDRDKEAEVLGDTRAEIEARAAGLAPGAE
jgi:hypothetical protein